jgi:hypothetical protein
LVRAMAMESHDVPIPHKARSSHWKWLSPKPFTIILATLLGLLGSIGQFLFIEDYDNSIAGIAEQIHDIEQRVATLRSTQNEYFNGYVVANLLFALNPADSTQDRGVTADMYRLAVLDKAAPFRAIMAELSMAGVFPFTETNDKYRTLSEAARADLTRENYVALNEFEKSILDRALTLQHDLQDKYFVALDAKNKLEAARDNRRYWLTMLTAIITILMLAANLIAERRAARPT